MVRKQAHEDPRDGVQYHLRYEPAHDPGRFYWTSIGDDREYALELLQAYRGSPDMKDVQVFVRDVTPWRQLDTTLLVP